jgi:hypothetical protein
MSVEKVNQAQIHAKTAYGDIIATATDWSNMEGLSLSVHTAKHGMQSLELTHAELDTLMLAVQELKVNQG